MIEIVLEKIINNCVNCMKIFNDKWRIIANVKRLHKSASAKRPIVCLQFVCNRLLAKIFVFIAHKYENPLAILPSKDTFLEANLLLLPLALAKVSFSRAIHHR